VFRPDPRLSHVPATADEVVAVIESINQPQVSIPGKQPQAVQAHLVGLRNRNGTFSIYAGLFLPLSGENVVYAHERPEIPLEAYREVEAEGLHFLESMGFMLDNTNFRNLTPDGQAQVLKRVPLFAPPRRAEAAPAAGDKAPPRQALARLLAGF